MDIIAAIITIILVFKVPRWIDDWKFNSYDTSKVDWLKVSDDKNLNHLSGEQVRSNIVRGKYDKK